MCYAVYVAVLSKKYKKTCTSNYSNGRILKYPLYHEKRVNPETRMQSSGRVGSGTSGTMSLTTPKPFGQTHCVDPTDLGHSELPRPSFYSSMMGILGNALRCHSQEYSAVLNNLANNPAGSVGSAIYSVARSQSPPVFNRSEEGAVGDGGWR